MADFHIYKGTVTSGGTNGTLVSEDNAETSQIATAALRADTNEVGADIKLAVRCDTGFVTSVTGGHHMVITPVGTNAAKWALAPDNAGSAGSYGAYGAALNIDSQVDATNTIFWAKAKATSDEAPSNDTSVNLQAVAVIAAA